MEFIEFIMNRKIGNIIETGHLLVATKGLDKKRREIRMEDRIPRSEDGKDDYGLRKVDIELGMFGCDYGMAGTGQEMADSRDGSDVGIEDIDWVGIVGSRKMVGC